jgi:hypothetical protein
MKTRYWIVLFLISLLLPSYHRVHASPSESLHRPNQRIELWFFWSARCPHCLEARPHILQMASDNPWIDLHDLELTQHPEHVQRYIELAAEMGQQAQSVPAFLFCDHLEVGWESQAVTGQRLLQALKACLRGATAGANLPLLNLPGLGDLSSSDLSLPLLTLLIAGMDAFNPCAFFVLLFLLSLLIHQQNRRRMLIVGGVFVLFSGLMYFSFMAAWLGLFRIMGNLPWITLAAGLLALFIGLINVKDFFAFKQGITLSIPESRKADLFQRGRRILASGSLPAMLMATVLLAVAANFYELLCTAGFPMVYTRLLTLQVHNSTLHFFYLALYNLIYVLPLLTIVLAFVFTMGSRKLSEREGRLLKLLSGLMMTGLGVMLIVSPEGLNNLTAAFGLIAISVALTWLAARISASKN